MRSHAQATMELLLLAIVTFMGMEQASAKVRRIMQAWHQSTMKTLLKKWRKVLKNG